MANRPQSLRSLGEIRKVDSAFSSAIRRPRQRMAQHRQYNQSRSPTRCGRKRGAANQGIGRSRGGLSTKVHLVVDALGLQVRLGCRSLSETLDDPRDAVTNRTDEALRENAAGSPAGDPELVSSAKFVRCRRHRGIQQQSSNYDAKSLRLSQLRSRIDRAVSRARKPAGARLAHPQILLKRLIPPPNEPTCGAMPRGKGLYVDTEHITVEAANLIVERLAPFLK